MGRVDTYLESLHQRYPAVDVATLQQRMGYSFRQPARLKRALTHRSAGADNNERLEFLGDSALNFIIARWLFQQFPREQEGVLSRLRAHLVCTETLAALATELELDQLIYLGLGERKAGGHQRESILADTMEALVGAILLDGGVEEMEAFVRWLWTPRIERLDPYSVYKDPKTRLQEFLQGQGQSLPAYELIETAGADHNQRFYIRCVVAGGKISLGEGSSKRRAEQEAAQRMLEQLRTEAASADRVP